MYKRLSDFLVLCDICAKKPNSCLRNGKMTFGRSIYSNSLASKMLLSLPFFYMRGANFADITRVLGANGNHKATQTSLERGVSIHRLLSGQKMSNGGTHEYQTVT